MYVNIIPSLYFIIVNLFDNDALIPSQSPLPKRSRCLHSEDKPQTVSKQPQKTRKKRLTLSSKKKTPVKTEKDAGSKKREATEEGYCPFCQMPFRILVVESATWHVSDCLSHPVTALQGWCIIVSTCTRCSKL